MTVDTLIKRGAIYVNNITEVLDELRHDSIKLNEQQASELFRQLMKDNGREHSFADFYYFQLDETARENIDSMLNPNEIRYLESISPYNPNEVVFPLTEQLIDIIVKLNAAEMLFSTLYFTLDKSTWWGNYQYSYEVFREKTVMDDDICYFDITDAAYQC